MGLSHPIRRLLNRQARDPAGECNGDAPAGEFARTVRARTGEPVREGELVRLRRHLPLNLAAFQRWYGDPEIAELLRHDLEPLTAAQSQGYFETVILPLSARGLCYAIHDTATDTLVGTSALTDVIGGSALFRIVIGEKDFWGQGRGTEATALVVAEAFETHNFNQVRLEVFRHNQRAVAAYTRAGFHVTGEHTEWVSHHKFLLHIIEMAIDRDTGAGTA
ncbi:MAG: GNAT family N-acetyltransferase [Chloroflexota bacterium]|nr:GNAT family N-acetyltransferase [Chloroflexota bacterium]